MKRKIINAGKYNKKIEILKKEIAFDDAGFKKENLMLFLEPYASINTLRGYTLIQNNSDFEKAYTNFTIRYPIKKITRDMLIRYKDILYTIEYLNNIDNADIELEIQAKEIIK